MASSKFNPTLTKFNPEGSRSMIEESGFDNNGLNYKWKGVLNEN